MTRPRALLLTPDYPPALGGIQLLSERLAEGFRTLSLRVVAIVGDEAREHDRERPVPIVRAGVSAAPHRLNVLLLNGRALAAGVFHKPDVVLSLHVVCAPAALALRRSLGVPYVQYVHADEVGNSGLTAIALKHAHTVIAVSRHSRDLAISSGAPAERVKVIHPGVDPARREGSRAVSPTVLTVASTDYRYKGHDVMLRALPLIRRRVPAARWVAVGGGALLPLYEALARHSGLDGCVQFCGRVSEEERNNWFNRAHVFAMPSRVSAHGGGEGFGIAYLEAGTYGLPVVAGDVAGARDAVIDGETGVLVDPEDHVAVAAAVSDLLLDDERRTRLGRAGARKAAEQAWPAVAARVETVLLEAAGAT
jgi:phosphatidylinositol alpha-1,6-mannosyltransferase